jgi:hypothetical protein
MVLTTGFKRKVNLKRASRYFTKLYVPVMHYFRTELSDPNSVFSRSAKDKNQALFSAVRIAGDVFSAWIFGELNAQPRPNQVFPVAKGFVYMAGMSPEERAIFRRRMSANIRKLLDATGSASKSDPLVINMEDNSWKIVDSKFKPHKKELDLYARTLLKVWRGDISGLRKMNWGLDKDAEEAFAKVVTTNRWLVECLTDFIASIESPDYVNFIIKMKKYGNKPYVLSKFIAQVFDYMAKMEKEGG